MNQFIPRLLRLKYAANMIAGLEKLKTLSVEKKIDERDMIIAETELPLYKEQDGKRRALNGRYIGRIFLDIETVTHISISELNHRKRIMGIYGNIEEYQPDEFYRDTLVKYLGLGRWQNLEKNGEELCKLMENRLLADNFSSLQGAIPPRVSINTKNLNEGDTVELTLNEDAAVTFKYLGEYRFKVKSVSVLSLKVGDILEIHSPFIIRNRIYAENLHRSRTDKGEYLSIHHIIDFKQIGGPESQKEHLKRLDEILAKANEKRRIREENARQNMVEKAESTEKSHTFAEVNKKVKNMNKKNLSVLGAGSYCFDTIVKREYPEGFVPGKKNKFTETVVSEEIGSNPGNVLCILGYFGWNSYPIALFDDSAQGLQLTKDFNRYGCDTRFVSNTPDGGTNLLKVIHCLDKDTGKPVTKFSKRHAPGSGFPKDKNLTVKGENATLPVFINNLDFLPDVYFFESTTACWRELAKYLRSKGVLTYYEIQRMSEKEFSKFLGCMKESDIVKFSDETVKDLSFVDELKDKLVIQTLGAKGVRFNFRGEGWVNLAPVVNKNVVDTEGCGDWTTASFINALGDRGKLKLSDITADVVKECLQEAQEYASRNVEYMGTKGAIAADKSFGLEPSGYIAPAEG